MTCVVRQASDTGPIRSMASYGRSPTFRLPSTISGDLSRFLSDGLANRPGTVRVLLVLPLQGGVPERGPASEGEGVPPGPFVPMATTVWVVL